LGPGKFIRILAPDGRTLAHFGTVPTRIAAADVPTVPPVGGITVGNGREAHRVLWHRGPDGTSTEIGVSAHGRLRALRHATGGIVAGASALLVLLVGVAWVVAGRATVELDRLASE